MHNYVYITCIFMYICINAQFHIFIYNYWLFVCTYGRICKFIERKILHILYI